LFPFSYIAHDACRGGNLGIIPAAQLARHKGIDVVLDPMPAPVPEHLHEHVHGLRSTCPKQAAAKIGDIKKIRITEACASGACWPLPVDLSGKGPLI
jgi:hypothetical protein